MKFLGAIIAYLAIAAVLGWGILLAVSGLPPWGSIEVSLRWPILLNDLVPVKLVVHGDIVRSDGECSAVKFSQYDFHTTSSRC